MTGIQEGRRRRPGPAVGPGGRLPRRVLLRRAALALVLAALLVIAKLVVSRLEARDYAKGWPGHVLGHGLIVGRPPTDYELKSLAGTLRVAGVINLGTPIAAEEQTALGLDQGYEFLAMKPDGSPTWDQLRAMAGFVRKYTTGGSAVYVNDNEGGGPSAAAAAMLLLLRGQSWPSISARMTHDELRSMCACQLRAIRQLGSALSHPGRVPAGGAYAAARKVPW